MRSEKEIISLVLSVAETDERIRAVILNGSRTNPNIIKDTLQDFDVIYLVENVSAFNRNPHWIDVFGERLIMQQPNGMQLNGDDPEPNQDNLTYLMLFTDLNRIDLNLIDKTNTESCKDSLNRVLLDKDQLFAKPIDPSDKDYWVKSPLEKQFLDCCNEFWWVTTYVLKGLIRNEPTYAKEMMEIPVRTMFMKMLAWHVGTKTNFSVNVGKSNRFLKKYVSSGMWDRILKTYPDATNENIWKSFLEMTQIFHELGVDVAKQLGFNYNFNEAKNVREYLLQMQENIKVK